MVVEFGFNWHKVQNYKVGVGGRIFFENQIHNFPVVIDIHREDSWIWSILEKISRLEGGKQNFEKWDCNTFSKINSKKWFWNEIENQKR